MQFRLDRVWTNGDEGAAGDYDIHMLFDLLDYPGTFHDTGELRDGTNSNFGYSDGSTYTFHNHHAGSSVCVPANTPLNARIEVWDEDSHAWNINRIGQSNGPSHHKRLQRNWNIEPGSAPAPDLPCRIGEVLSSNSRDWSSWILLNTGNQDIIGDSGQMRASISYQVRWKLPAPGSSRRAGVQLGGSPAANTGVVAVYAPGMWTPMPVCLANFGLQDAEVVCRELGLANGGWSPDYTVVTQSFGRSPCTLSSYWRQWPRVGAGCGEG